MISCGGGLFVMPRVEQAELTELLHGLRGERCAHSWRNIDPDCTLEHLQRWENALRPTSIFFYYTRDSEKGPDAPLRLVGAATVADAIHRDFPFAGFPILARCYLRPEFRTRGLYRHTVQHRIEFCHRRFRDSLKAIHLGTANHRVAHTISQPTEDRDRFVQVGSQVVQAGEDVYLVGAYVHLTPGYARSLAAALENANADGEDAPEVAPLRAALDQLMGGPDGEHAVSLNHLYRRAHAAGALAQRDVSGLVQLLALFKAIPVMGLDDG